MKQITVIGNLGANAIRRTATNGNELMTFNVAVNAGKDAQPVWFNCVSNFREGVFGYLVKGQCVCVTGDLTAGLYKGQIDLSINADRIELCGARPQNAPAEPDQAPQN